MRFWYLLVLFTFAGGALWNARADVILSGSVQSYSGSSGTPCSVSGTSSSSLSLNCGALSSSSTQATVTGTATPYGGSLYVNASGSNNYPYFAVASEQLDLNETYVLTGGSGAATLTFLLDFPGYQFGDQGSFSCTFTFDGTSQSCNGLASVGELSLPAEYGVPFSIGLEIDRMAAASGGEDTGGETLTYSLDGPGLVATPEPSSFFLLISAAAAMLLAAKCRVTTG